MFEKMEFSKHFLYKEEKMEVDERNTLEKVLSMSRYQNLIDDVDDFGDALLYKGCCYYHFNDGVFFAQFVFNFNEMKSVQMDCQITELDPNQSDSYFASSKHIDLTECKFYLLIRFCTLIKAVSCCGESEFKTHPDLVQVRKESDVSTIG